MLVGFPILSISSSNERLRISSSPDKMSKDADSEPSTTSTSKSLPEDSERSATSHLTMKEEGIHGVNCEDASDEDLVFPEGGLQGWATLLGAFLVQFATFGYTNAFGVYQGTSDFYVREYLTNYTASEIGWIGGTQIFFIFSIGLFTGRAFDRGYFHYLVIGSALLFSFSYFMLSISEKNKYYQVYLSQGVGSGLGVGLSFIPCVGVVSQYFQKRRAFAIGVVAAGTAVGAVVHPLILNNFFQGSLGFQKGVRISTAINTSILLVANLLMRTRLPPQKKFDAIPFSAFARDVPYVFVVLGVVVGMFGLQFPNFFLQLYSVKLGISNNISFRCLSILNGSSVVGRILFPLFASKCGVFNLNIFFTASMGIMLYCFQTVKDETGVIAFAVIYGILSGGAVSYTPVMMASLAKDVSEIGSRIGIAFAFTGCVGLVATAIDGALLSTRYLWWRPILFCGTTTILSASLFAVSRHVISKRDKTQIL